MQDIFTDDEIDALRRVFITDMTSARDNEITYIIQKFYEIWLKHPMLRFQQVIELIKTEANLPNDIFYLPDNELLDILIRLTDNK